MDNLMTRLLFLTLMFIILTYNYNIFTYLLLWFGCNHLVRHLIINQVDIFYANVVACNHAIVVTIITMWTLVSGDYTSTINLYNLSLAYFIYDLFNCLDDKLFIVHHIICIILLFVSIDINKCEYFPYSNALLLTGEITGILQNYFFSIKLLYDDKLEFAKEYFTLFKIYTILFKYCRLILYPLITYLFLSVITEFYYYIIIAISSTFIILDSLVWIKGQNKKLNHMRDTITLI